ncbi:MAG: MBL fold metallo-hydrolase [Clostridia bacterium]|nr:MBL fold metallo-hydrolase [Clostridia bacterium]
MEILRTANAGVLLSMDGQNILLDGVCPPYKTYLGTPPHIRENLLKNPPDVLAFTHQHADHYDEGFAESFQKNTLRPVLRAEDYREIRVGNIDILPFPTRHIGKYHEDKHVSYIIKGSKTILFTGDASPTVFEKLSLPKIDIVISSFAYALTASAFSKTKALGADKIILLHMPSPENDPDNIWQTVKDVTAKEQDLFILSLEEKIII